MPTYGYRCTKCATEFEAWERMADPPAGLCPSCGAKGQRLFFPAGIVFKGSGFYKTDSRSSDGGSAAHKVSAAGDAKEKVASDGAPAASDSQRSTDKASSSEGESGAAGGKASNANRGDSASKGGNSTPPSPPTPPSAQPKAAPRH